MEIIEKNGISFAILVRTRQQEATGTEFFTPKECTIQVGIIRHPNSYTEEPHSHRPKKRLVTETYETLYVTKGSVVVDFFHSLKGSKPFQSVELRRGDLILLLDGVHRIRTEKGFVGIKVKQGPYVSIEDDKVVRS